jgi:transcriptional regulator with XRE-family HTH domain
MSKRKGNVIQSEETLRAVQSLTNYRRLFRVKQTEIAEVTGFTNSHISDIERGLVDVRVSTLEKYAETLGLRVRLVIEADEESD